MKTSIRVKISLLVGILSFIIAFVVGNYANNLSTAELEKKAAERLTTLSKHVAEILDREMLERYREIQFAATMPALTDENSSVEEKRDFLEKIKKNQKHHEWIGFALPSGVVQAGTNRYLEGKNASARPWLPAGLKGPYIGDVHDALLLAKLMPNTSSESIYFTDVAAPVKNKDGKVLGVLCSHLMWQWTRNVVRSIQKDHDVEIFLLSKDNLILVGPNDTERKNLSDISANVADAFKNATTTYKVINWSNNMNYLTAHSLSKGFEEYKGFEWKVIVRQPLKEAFKEVESNSKSLIIFSLIAGILGAIVSILIANSITSPIKKLHIQIEKFKDGKNITQDKTVTTKEIADIQDALIELQNSLSEESNLKEEAQKRVDIALQVFDQSLEGILITDKDNKTILVNKAFTQITGYNENEIYGKNPSILNSGNHDKEFYSKMWDELIEKGKWSGELTNKKKDGSTYIEHLKITTLKNNNGEIVNYLATFNSGFN